MSSLASAKRAAVASQPNVAQVVAGALARGAAANAVDAVAAGLFAGAALDASVLLGPVQILVGGPGVGLRAIDGRTRQPGQGAPRPRGFLSSEPIAGAARVAVPAFLPAIAAALAAAGAGGIARAAGPAVEMAERLDDARAALLRRVAQRGAAALSDERVADELVAAAGRVAGGLLTREDLSQVRPAVEPCAMREEGERAIGRAPWRTAEGDGACVEIVAATDARGNVAIACYERAAEGLAVPELGLVAPRHAAPVMRGEPRVRPGTVLASPSPIALATAAGAIELAIGARGDATAARLDALVEKLALATQLDAALAEEDLSTVRVIGVARSRAAARAIGAGA